MEAFPSRQAALEERFTPLESVDVVPAVRPSPVRLDVAGHLQISRLAGRSVKQHEDMGYRLILSRRARVGHTHSSSDERCAEQIGGASTGPQRVGVPLLLMP